MALFLIFYASGVNFTKAYVNYTEAIDGALESLKLTDNSEANSIEIANLIKSNDCIKNCFNNRSLSWNIYQMRLVFE